MFRVAALKSGISGTDPCRIDQRHWLSTRQRSIRLPHIVCGCTSPLSILHLYGLDPSIDSTGDVSAQATQEGKPAGW